ncbi:hypothetical protein G7046_g9215 [Stylonectria norvegica]|nr:hypothetical protein G7046_g9215 [Stylonectria norvegica]
MGILSNPLRSREPRLPIYQKLDSPTKERLSDDEYYSSDDASTAYSSRPSTPNSSRATSGTIESGLLMVPRRKKPTPSGRPGSAYPYRLPPKITRYLLLAVVGMIVLMIASLVRASQVENWKVMNGKLEERPQPPAVWEKFPFLTRYYGGIRTLVSLKDDKPEYPHVKDEPSLLPDVSEETEAEQDDVEAEQEDVETNQEDKDITGSEISETKRALPASLDWSKYPGRNEEKDMQECFLDAAGTVRIPHLRYYNGRPKGFPENVIGSYDLLNLPEDICFERFGRYGPYGFGYSARSGGLGTGEHGESEGSTSTWEKTSRVDYRGVDWADVQRRCFVANSGRYKKNPAKTPEPHGFYVEGDVPDLKARDVEESTNSSSSALAVATSSVASKDGPKKDVASKKTSGKDGKKKDLKNKKARTAVVVRCWDEYLFREDDIANMRSMITELALASGGRYDIHLLVQVKNDAEHPIWADHGVYEQHMKDVIPEEFRGLVTFWTETQMLSLYQGIHDLFSRGPDLPVHGVYRGLSMAMQYFAYMHPEYEYFWQWEMDVRYTGHYYDLFTKLEGWAKAQPRKGLWERNSRFYFPSVHGTWDDFSQMSRVQSEMAASGNGDDSHGWKGLPGADDAPDRMAKNEKPIWGPHRPADDDDWFEPQNDPIAPASYERDHYQWGVGEEADYISLNPLFDPEGTTWGLRDDITGFNRTEAMPPRRANIITTRQR